MSKRIAATDWALGEVCGHDRLGRSCDLCALLADIAAITRERDEAHAKIKTVADAITPWMLSRGITGVHATDAVQMLVEENAAVKADRDQAEADARTLADAIRNRTDPTVYAEALNRWRTK